MDADNILTLEDVAELLKVSERTIITWVDKERFPGGKLGTTWRFIRSDVEKWVVERVSPKELSINSPILLQKYFSPKNIFKSDFTCQKDVFDFLASKASIDLGLSKEDVLEKVWHREELMSTGIGCSIGLPHIRLQDVNNINVYVAFNQQPIADYKSIDDKVIHVVALIVAGTNVQSEYLKFLSSLTSILKNHETLQQLLACKTAKSIHLKIIELHNAA